MTKENKTTFLAPEFLICFDSILLIINSLIFDGMVGETYHPLKGHNSTPPQKEKWEDSSLKHKLRQLESEHK